MIFVGLKMVWLNELYGGKFPIGLSLGVIVGVIGLSVALSRLFPKAPRELEKLAVVSAEPEEKG